MENLERPRKGIKINRSPGDRVLVALMCLLLGVPSGIGTWFFLRNAFTFPKAPIESWSVFAFGFFLEEMAQAVFLLCLMGLIWAAISPDWLQDWIEKHAGRKLIVVLLTFVMSLIAISLIR